jgi:hypothetical protein
LQHTAGVLRQAPTRQFDANTIPVRSLPRLEQPESDPMAQWQSRPCLRATEVRREFEAVTLAGRQGVDEAVEADLTIALTSVYGMLVETIGPVLALTERQKLSVSTLLSKHARLHAPGNTAKSRACALLSLHFKALAIPGTDADYVIGATAEMIDGAFAKRRLTAATAAGRGSP